MSRPLSLSRQPVVHQYLRTSSSVTPSCPLMKPSRCYSSLYQGTAGRVSAFGQTSLTRITRGYSQQIIGRAAKVPDSLKTKAPQRLYCSSDSSKQKGIKASFWGRVVGDVQGNYYETHTKVGGSTALIFAGLFGGTAALAGGGFVYCKLNPESGPCPELIQAWKDYRGIKKN